MKELLRLFCFRDSALIGLFQTLIVVLCASPPALQGSFAVHAQAREHPRVPRHLGQQKGRKRGRNHFHHRNFGGGLPETVHEESEGDPLESGEAVGAGHPQGLGLLAQPGAGRDSPRPQVRQRVHQRSARRPPDRRFGPVSTQRHGRERENGTDAGWNTRVYGARVLH